VRRNVIRRLREACGLWFDVDARHCRMTDNVFAEITTAKGAIQMECCCHAPNRIDGNVFWAISRAYTDEEKPAEDPWRGGFGIYADCNDRLTIDHNLFGRIESYAVDLNLCQHDRVIGSRPGMCRHNRILNNVFCGCAHAILFARREDNASDGNVFASLPGGPCRSAPTCPPLCIQFPEPIVRLDLEGWRDYTGLDLRSSSIALEAAFRTDDLELTWAAHGDAPQRAPAPVPDGGDERAAPGPMSPEQWQVVLGGQVARQQFPGSTTAEGGAAGVAAGHSRSPSRLH
jgi:hypothetical protein